MLYAVRACESAVSCAVHGFMVLCGIPCPSARYPARHDRLTCFTEIVFQIPHNLLVRQLHEWKGTILEYPFYVYGPPACSSPCGLLVSDASLDTRLTGFGIPRGIASCTARHGVPHGRIRHTLWQLRTAWRPCGRLRRQSLEQVQRRQRARARGLAHQRQRRSARRRGRGCPVPPFPLDRTTRPMVACKQARGAAHAASRRHAAPRDD